jgi:hypothetical protein
MSFVSVEATQGSCRGTTRVRCELGELAPGASARVAIVARPFAIGRFAGRAFAEARELDPNVSNQHPLVRTFVPA